MKNTIYTLALTLFAFTAFAQDRTTVTSTSFEISDNLDLKAVASIFGDSQNLEDFERRLNDPKIQISNLDLNNDRQVDYLRVIESVEGGTHLIIVQSVLDRDVYQDVATIEVERDRNNQVQVQVVGDVYMYGHNYIYEPVYVTTPIIYHSFWVTSYRPYYSGWHWNYYPSYYYAWAPFPIFRYRSHIHNHINIHNHYNYVNIRRSDRAVALYSTRRSNGYERQYPTRSFAHRNANVTNHYELNQTRTIANSGTRNSIAANTRNETPRATTRSESFAPRNTSNTRSRVSAPRPNTRTETVVPRASSNVRHEASSPRTTTRTENSMPRSNSNTRVESTRVNTRVENTEKRENSNARSNARSESPATRENSGTKAASSGGSQRMESQTNGGNTNRGTSARSGNSGQRNSNRN